MKPHRTPAPRSRPRANRGLAGFTITEMRRGNRIRFRAERDGLAVDAWAAPARRGRGMLKITASERAAMLRIAVALWRAIHDLRAMRERGARGAKKKPSRT